METSQDFIVTDFSSSREKMITAYVRNHPNCSINKVIVYCKGIQGGPPKKTVERILLKLEEEGIITERPNPDDKRSCMLTVASGNLLEILPKDLEGIFSRVLAFTKLIKKMIENGNTIGDKPRPNHISEMVTYEAKRSLPFLPYYVTAIINSLYTFYFIFVLPQTIENRNLIAKLHSWYFENLSKIYSYYRTELGNTVYYSSDIAVMVKSKINLGYIEDQGPGLYPVYRIVRMCRINGIEEELYDVLDQLWIRNEKSSVLFYALNDDGDESSKEHFTVDMKDASRLFESRDKDFVQKNKTLKKIHLQIDSYLNQLERHEDEAQREIFEAGYPYDPPEIPD